jgi:chitinase
VNLAVDRYINAGVAPSKVMIGIPFFGYRWTGGRVTGPQQSWAAAPTLEAVPYHTIAPSITAENYQQDLNARVPYLTVDSLADESDSFVTFDDAWSVQEKVSYAIVRGIGGWMISDLSSDYLPNQTPSQPLLSAIAAVRNVLADPTGPVASDQEDPAQ